MDERVGGPVSKASAGELAVAHSHEIDTPPVFDGLIAANGRPYLTSTDGTVRCFTGSARP